MSFLKSHSNIIKHQLDVNGSQMVYDSEKSQYVLIKLIFPDDECLDSHGEYHKLKNLMPIDAKGHVINQLGVDEMAFYE